MYYADDEFIIPQISVNENFVCLIFLKKLWKTDTDLQLFRGVVTHKKYWKPTPTISPCFLITYGTRNAMHYYLTMRRLCYISIEKHIYFKLTINVLHILIS